MEPSKQAQTYSREQYASAKFWDDRYKQKVTYFDWYAQYPQLKYTFEEHYGMKKDDYILMIGCGNSKVSQQMYKAGYSRICNIDISEAVIQQMKKSTQGMDMQWLVMDATQLKFEDCTFDCIIDKGTMDALVSGNNLAPVEKMIKELERVMKKDGQMILITYGSPQGRKKVFQGSIGLNNYDYYFSKVDLNDQSTLINLMRSNLGNRPLVQIMGDKKALQKSMMEYSFVQALRRKRKNQKFIISWDSYQKKQVKFHDIEQQLAEKSDLKVNQEQNKKQQQNITKQQSTQVNEKKQQTKESEPPKKTYNPRKQCYCYVYSIRHKYTASLDQVIQAISNKTIDELLSMIKGSKIEGQKIFLPATNQEADKQINLLIQNNDQAIKNALLACIYLTKQKINYPSINLFRKLEDIGVLNENSINLQIISGDRCSSSIIMKSQLVFKVQRTNDSKNTAFQTFVDFMEKMMVQQYDLHPTPQVYSFLNSIKDKLNLNMINLLKKYWYPTWRYGLITQESVTVILSLPTSAPLAQIENQLKKKLKSRKIEILSVHQGYTHATQFSAISALNQASLSWNNGQKLNLILQDFSNNWQFKNSQDKILTFSMQRNMKNNLAHLFSLV